MNRKGLHRKGKEPVGICAVHPPYDAQISCDVTP